jgi:hypothetical protein
MMNCGYQPTRHSVNGAYVEDLARQMTGGPCDWAARGPVLVTRDGRIVSGHHRIIAARLAGIDIPPGTITRVATSERQALPWASVTVRAPR